MTNYFDILGVSFESTESEIRTAYHRLAKQYHPDVNHHEGSHAQFILIQKAYDVLINPATRRAHLILLHENRNKQKTIDSQRERNEIYEEWVRRQHREALKRKVAEMRRKEEEEQGALWRYLGFFKFFLPIVITVAFAAATIIPLWLFVTDERQREEAGGRLIFSSLMTTVFLFFLYHYDFLGIRKRKP